MGSYINNHSNPQVRLMYEDNGQTTYSPPIKEMDLDNKNKEKPMSTQVYMHVKGCNVLRHDGQNAYLYDEREKFYRKLTFSEWVHMLKRHVSQETRHCLMKRHCTEAFELLVSDPDIQMDFQGWRFQNPLKIPCESGILDLETMTVTEGSPWIPASLRFSFEYVPNAKIEEAPAFMSFVRSSLNYDNQPELTNLLLICLGYVLSGSNRWRKAIVLLGPTACGKSVIASFLQKVIGDENCSNVSIGKIGEKFRTYKLSESVVNITYELENGCIKNADIFKAAVSGDKLSGQKKYSDETSFSASSKLVMCSNVLPSLGNKQSDGSNDAIFDRFLFIPFSKSIPAEERDTELLNKLYSERSIIMSVAVEMFYYGLHINGYKTPKCQSSEECMLNFKREQNVFETFAEDYIVRDADARVSIARIYDAFSKYCWVNCFPNDMGNTEIKRFMRNKYPEVKYRKIRFSSGSVRWGFTGIRLVDQEVPRTVEHSKGQILSDQDN